MDKKIVLELAMNAGVMLLSNGASTHRIENYIKTILDSRKFEKSEVFVTTTGIIVTIESDSTGLMTMVKNVSNKNMHLEKIALIETIINNFLLNKVTPENALTELEKIKNINSYSFLTTTLAFGGAGAFRTLMFDGTYLDSIASFLVGICLAVFVQTLKSQKMTNFLVTIIGGFTVGFTSILLLRYGMGSSLEKIIIGSLIAIAPGVPFAHAANDIINGDHVSGGIRAMEALVSGIALACGTAFSIQFWSFISGGVQ